MAVENTRISTASIIQKTSDVCFGRVVYQPGGTYGPRVQMDFQIVAVLRGSAEVDVEKDRRVIPAGFAGIFSPGRQEFFQFSKELRTDHTWCSVKPSALAKDVTKTLEAAPVVLPVSRVFSHLMEAAFALPDVTGSGKALLENLASMLFVEYHRMRANDGDRDKDRAWNRARSYIEERFADGNVLSEAAERCGISPQHLRREFRKHMAISPSEYLWSLRVQRGIGLLSASGLQIGEISDRCGFKSPFHFSRLVRKYAGLPPKELRKRAWNPLSQAHGTIITSRGY